MGGPAAEPGGPAARGQGEEGGVEDGGEMADLQFPAGEPAAVDEEAGDLAAGAGPVHCLAPALGGEAAAGGEEDVEAGGGRALRVDDTTVLQEEGAAVTEQGAGGAFRGEPGEEGGDCGEGVRSRGLGGHLSTSPSARALSLWRARARLPSARSSQRWRKTLLSKLVSTKRRTW